MNSLKHIRLVFIAVITYFIFSPSYAYIVCGSEGNGCGCSDLGKPCYSCYAGEQGVCIEVGDPQGGGQCETNTFGCQCKNATSCSNS